MRVPGALYAARGRAPQNEKDVPFQEILPLRLKNSVSGKADSGNDVACLQEMGVLFACLKDIATQVENNSQDANMDYII